MTGRSFANRPGMVFALHTRKLETYEMKRAIKKFSDGMKSDGRHCGRGYCGDEDTA
ncbi:MAG: hypothetical protein R3B74_05375 [Nitrospirales bacterium]|nr:hypothetical protein [Nitrospirales bacterium]